MDVVFFGSGAFGLPTLRALSAQHTLRAVVTQPDRPAGRGGRLSPTIIGEWTQTERRDVRVFKPDNVSAPHEAAAVRAVPADAWVVIAYGQKLSEPLLDGKFAVNLHASLLPRWRGAAPIHAAVLAGDRETGNSVITLAQRMDAGLILDQSRRPIEPHQTADELHDLLAEDGPELVLSVLTRHAMGLLDPRPQDERLATRAPKFGRADAWINLADSADACRRRVHAFSPWPGVSVEHRGQPLKLLRVADAARPHSAPPGQILDADDGLVACAPGTILALHTVQPPGKAAMPWRDYANGRRVQAGETITARRPDTPESPAGNA